MNISIVLWFAGIMATIYGLKFVIVLFRSLFNKEAMEDALESIGKKTTNASKVIKSKIEERKQKKQEKETEMAMPIIRKLY